ncbi:MAG: hypothetical protein MZV70_03385 [Desulfobacterales bacterium]|nr:hypothetical protein [Desulfobacterales bacterium]
MTRCATELAKKGYIIRDEELAYAQDPTDSNFILFTARVGKYFVDKSGMEASGRRHRDETPGNQD